MSGAASWLSSWHAAHRDVGGSEVLHLVDEDGNSDADIGGKGRGVEQQFDEVDLDIAGVGAARSGRYVDAWLPPLPHALVGSRAQRECLEHPQELVDSLRVSVRGRDTADRHVQRRRQWPAELLIGPRLDLPGTPSSGDCGRTQLVQQNRLPDAPQPRQYDAAFGSAAGDPFEDDVEGVELLLSAGEFWWALACAGSVRVTHGVHGAKVTTAIANYAYI